MQADCACKESAVAAQMPGRAVFHPTQVGRRADALTVQIANGENCRPRVLQVPNGTSIQRFHHSVANESFVILIANLFDNACERAVSRIRVLIFFSGWEFE